MPVSELVELLAVNHAKKLLTRRTLIQAVAGLAAAPALGAQPPAAVPRLPRLLLAGPFAGVSNPLVRLVDAGLLRGVADSVEFVNWKDPDQLRALALEGKADFIAMPSNVAANLYNRGVKLGLLDINTWGVLHMVSRDPALKTPGSS